VFRGFGNRAQGSGMAHFAGCAIGVSGVDDDPSHAAIRRAQVFLGDQDRGCHDKILREDRSGGSWHVTPNHGQVQRAGFLQAASGGGEAKSPRQRSF